MPFSGHAQNIYPFQLNLGLTNSSMSGFGSGNISHLFGQQWRIPFPTVGTSQVVPSLASSWNP